VENSERIASVMLDRLHARIAVHFSRAEPRQRVLAYLRGLLTPLERKNSWQLAASAGEIVPDGMQRLLAGTRWNADAVRDDLRGYVVEYLGDERAILVVDEAGFVKRGTKSAGVQRQYCKTVGRVENCQLGTFLGYVTPACSTFLDRELYLPREWANDRQRREEARVPPDVRFHTKPELAKIMLERAVEAGVPARWVAGSKVFGANRQLRAWLELRHMPYVLAVPLTESFQTIAEHGSPVRVDTLAIQIPAERWQRLSVRMHNENPKSFDWVRIPTPSITTPGMGSWLLARRTPVRPAQLTCYLSYGPAGTPLTELVRAAEACPAVEAAIQTARRQVGLDQYEVRRYDAWYRHTTLALLAHALLKVTQHCLSAPAAPPMPPSPADPSIRYRSPRPRQQAHQGAQAAAARLDQPLPGWHPQHGGREDRSPTTVRWMPATRAP
jgi:SRSO17 transposase